MIRTLIYGSLKLVEILWKILRVENCQFSTISLFNRYCVRKFTLIPGSSYSTSSETKVWAGIHGDCWCFFFRPANGRREMYLQ